MIRTLLLSLALCSTYSAYSMSDYARYYVMYALHSTAQYCNPINMWRAAQAPAAAQQIVQPAAANNPAPANQAAPARNPQPQPSLLSKTATAGSEALLAYKVYNAGKITTDLTRAKLGSMENKEFWSTAGGFLGTWYLYSMIMNKNKEFAKEPAGSITKTLNTMLTSLHDALVPLGIYSLLYETINSCTRTLGSALSKRCAEVFDNNMTYTKATLSPNSPLRKIACNGASYVGLYMAYQIYKAIYNYLGSDPASKVMKSTRESLESMHDILISSMAYVFFANKLNIPIRYMGNKLSHLGITLFPDA